MKVHKRKKTTRIRGSRTFGWGFRQKHKGHGNKGGLGMAGTGKKADHKKQKAKSLDKKGKYFGKQGYTSRSTKKDKIKKMNLIDIQNNLFNKTTKQIELKDYKILGKVLAERNNYKNQTTKKRKKRVGNSITHYKENKLMFLFFNSTYLKHFFM